MILVSTKNNDYVFNALNAAFSLVYTNISWDTSVKNAYQMYEAFHPNLLFVHYTDFSPLLIQLINEYKIQTITYGFACPLSSDSLLCTPQRNTPIPIAHKNTHSIKPAANHLLIRNGYKKRQYIVPILCFMDKFFPSTIKTLDESDKTYNIVSLYNNIESINYIGTYPITEYRHLIKSSHINISSDGMFEYDFAFNKVFALSANNHGVYPKLSIDNINKFLHPDSKRERMLYIDEKYEIARNNTYLHRVRDICELINNEDGMRKLDKIIKEDI